MIMKVATAQTPSVLADAYRLTFREYSDKLKSLQLLMEFRSSDDASVEATLLQVETARIAHSWARDRLARRLIQSVADLTPQPAWAVSQSHIRDTARLLWELAGKPDGSAERDWHKAERLVERASAATC